MHDGNEELQHSGSERRKPGEAPSAPDGWATRLDQNLPHTTGQQATDQYVESVYSEHRYLAPLQPQPYLPAQASTSSLNESSVLYRLRNFKSTLVNAPEQIEEEEDETDEQDCDDEGVDAMGTTDGGANSISPSTTLFKRNQYYGPSSTSNLMKQIQEVVQSHSTKLLTRSGNPKNSSKIGKSVVSHVTIRLMSPQLILDTAY